MGQIEIYLLIITVLLFIIGVIVDRLDKKHKQLKLVNKQMIIWDDFQQENLDKYKIINEREIILLDNDKLEKISDFEDDKNLDIIFDEEKNTK